MPPSNPGNRYLLVAIDYLTRWPCVQAVPDVTAETTALFLFDQVFASQGVPSYVLINQAFNFTCSYVSSFLRRLECRHLTTTAYPSQTNGLVERMNQTLVQALSKIVRGKNDKHNWDKYLTAAFLAVRTTPNETMKFSPALLLYGLEMRTPSTWPVPVPKSDYVKGNLEEELISRTKVIKSSLPKLSKDATISGMCAKQLAKER